MWIRSYFQVRIKFEGCFTSKLYRLSGLDGNLGNDVLSSFKNTSPGFSFPLALSFLKHCFSFSKSSR